MAKQYSLNFYWPIWFGARKSKPDPLGATHIIACSRKRESICVGIRFDQVSSNRKIANVRKFCPVVLAMPWFL
jgi:hypothetical protein